MATVESKLYTADEFWEWIHFPENKNGWYELVRGEILEMPRPGDLHGLICFLIPRIIGNWLFEQGKGYACSNDTRFLVECDPDTVRGPDIMVFQDSITKEETSRKFTQRIPQLIIEVLSPEDRMSKTLQRLHQYFERGVPVVWVVDPENNLITEHRSGKEPTVKGEGEEISAEDVLPQCQFQVSDFFKLPGS